MTALTSSHEKFFYTVKEFCDWARIGTTTFYKLVGEEQIKIVKIGSKTLVTYSEAQNFVNRISEGRHR